MAINNVRTLVESEEKFGRFRSYHWVKNVTQVTTAGLWYDLSGSAGNPKAKQWFDAAPLTAAQIKQSTDGGFFHGGDVSADGSKKILRYLRAECASATPLPMSLMVCDYLLYYPTVEDGTTDPQAMTNSVTLPRYTDGEGVEMMAVTISSRTGGQQFYVTYTNSDGVAGRTSRTVTQNTAAAPGTITTSATNTQSGGHPFIPLQEGDRGVRSVESVTMLGADTGFFAIVLVKPLLNIAVRGNDAPHEKDPLIFNNEFPEIQDDAFISALAMPNGSLSGVAVRGNMKVVWG